MSARKATRTRSRYTRDAAWLRRARMHFALLCRPWVESADSIESYRGRLFLVAEAMCRHRLLAAKKAGRDAMFATLSQWRRADGVSWWPWRSADKRRMDAIDWGIRLSTIKMDAARERRRA